MPSLADQFLTEREAVLDDVPSLFAALKKGKSILTLMARLLGRTKMPGKPDASLRYFYRGQTDASWGISSSLYRVLRSAGPVTEDRMSGAEKRIVAAMRGQGLGHHMNDGELLMVLQHHGIPTRLVDVSSGWLPALWFATEHSDTVDGRLFIVGQRADANGGHPSIELGTSDDLPWAGAAIGRSYSSSSWSMSLMAVSDQSLDPRMRAQKGRFLVGGLTKRYAGENWSVDGDLVPASEWPDISTLRVFFPMKNANKPSSARWPAVGWSLRIPGQLKPEIRARLVNLDYTIDHMYPAFDESQRLGRYVATQPSRP